MTFEEALISVWKQAMEDNQEAVVLEGTEFPVKKTSQHRLRQVDFDFEGQDLRGLEQNPETKSRWAGLARQGKLVMQFLNEGKYVAVVVDGKAKLHGRKS